MADKQSWISKLRRVVDRDAAAPEPEAARPEPDAIEREVFDAEHSDYTDLLAELGAEAPAGDAADQAALKDAAISELTTHLANLRPLGDRFAEAERGRLDAVARTEALEAECARLREQVEALAARASESAALKKTLNAEKRARGSAEYRLRKAREKAEAKHRLATERWAELKELRGERRRLEKELKRQSKQLESVQSLVEGLARSEPKAARLAQLMADGMAPRAGRPASR